MPTSIVLYLIQLCWFVEILEIFIYFCTPRQANDILFINGLTEKTKISIYDLSGKTIINKQITDNQIDISYFQKGLYTLKIETANGIVAKKFIKQ